VEYLTSSNLNPWLLTRASIETPRYDAQAPWMSMPPKIDNGYS
jgi:hypothetical protein